MAFSRYSGTSNLLSLRNRENADLPVDRKAVAAKTTTLRSALGNISNKTTGTEPTGGKGLKGGRQETMKAPSRAVKTTESTVSSTAGPNAAVIKPASDECPAVITLEPISVKAVEQTEPMLISPGGGAPASSTEMDLSTNSAGDEAFSKQMLKLNIADIDRDDRDNPQLVGEYVNDIYQYLRQLEVQYTVADTHLAGQHEVTGRMRAILIDWLVQVHLRFHLLQETLYLTVGIIDRFLQLKDTLKTRLQLVGVASMWIAAKYEEMYAPEVADFVYITDNAYSKQDIRQMECHILKTLGFELGRPIPLHFLRRNSKAGEVDANTHTLAKYLMELTIVEYDLAPVCPSEIAAAALCLAMKLVCDNSQWTPTLVHYSGYTESSLHWLVCRLCQLVQRAGTGKLTAIKTKYQSSKFMRISKLAQLDSQLVKDLAAVDSHRQSS